VSQQEQELAQQIIGRLDDGLNQLDAGTRERLVAARRAALARYREAPVRVFGLIPVGPVGHFLGRHVFGTSVAAVTALVIATAGVIYWQSVYPNGDLADVEIGLLTDELPINAYLDKGFDSWLKRSPR
jgi:Protein of unknown function (DUF3619)